MIVVVPVQGLKWVPQRILRESETESEEKEKESEEKEKDVPTAPSLVTITWALAPPPLPPM